MYKSIEEICGTGVHVVNRLPVFGGDINRAYALNLSDGSVIFMKANTRKNLPIFEGEAESLDFISQTGTIRSPKPLAIGTDEDTAFLLMEYIRKGRGNSSSSRELGHSLALMHQADTAAFVKGGKFGALHDHLLGSGIQDNTPMDNWVFFFSECRLRPQFEHTASYFDSGTRRRINSFLEKLDRYLPEPEKASLLHGDLWGGNYIIDTEGHPWLIDPACYVGHAEADIAFTELFGGFDRAFYDAYWEVKGYDPAYRERRDIYNLYHLVKHLYLFGSGYLSPVLSILRRYI